jgi:hypothetical protein
MKENSEVRGELREDQIQDILFKTIIIVSPHRGLWPKIKRLLRK